jgi:hypothetical protein
VKSGVSVPALLCASLLAAPCFADARECIRQHEAGIAAKDERKLVQAKPSFLACARDECPTAVREECTELLAQIERKVPSVVVVVKDENGRDLVDVRLLVDGKVVSQELTGQAIELDPGKHEFRVEHARSGTLTERVLVVEGEKSRRVRFDFPRKDPPKSPEAKKPPAVRESRSIPVASYVLGGIGVLALGSFGYFALSGRAKENDLDVCSPKCDPAEVDVMRRRYLIADISLGVAVVAFGSAVGVALIPSDDRKSATLRLSGSF